MLKHKVSYENIIRHSSEQNVRDVIYEMASIANSHLMKVIFDSIFFLNHTQIIICIMNLIIQAKKLEKEIDKNIKSIFLPFVPLQLYLDKLQKADFNVFDKKLQERNNWLPLKLLWHKIFY